MSDDNRGTTMLPRVAMENISSAFLFEDGIINASPALRLTLADCETTFCWLTAFLSLPPSHRPYEHLWKEVYLSRSRIDALFDWHLARFLLFSKKKSLIGRSRFHTWHVDGAEASVRLSGEKRQHEVCLGTTRTIFFYKQIIILSKHYWL